MSDSQDLMDYLWPIVSQMIQTVIENKQNLIVEGCYIPFNWKNSFSQDDLKDIKFYCLVLSKDYIYHHFDEIQKYANIIEKRQDDDCTLESILKDNEYFLKQAQKYHQNYIYIEDDYDVDIDLYEKT